MKSSIKPPEGPFDASFMDSDEEGGSSSEPAHHARRPMNAFLIFCKRHRGVVRERYPTLENRCITKILGEWWAQLEPSEKTCYTELAKQYKEAFLRANPDFKWYKLPAPPLRTLVTRPSNQKPPRMECPLATGPIVPGKLADESQMGGLSSLLSSPPHTPTSPSVPKPPKKRYLEETFAGVDQPSSSTWDPPNEPKDENSRESSLESESKDSGLSAVSPTETVPGPTVSGANWTPESVIASLSGPSTGMGTTRVQASQQQLIERVVDRICGSLSPEPLPTQPSWPQSRRETNNNEMSCVNVHGEEQGDQPEEQGAVEVKASSSETCDHFSEVDSALSSREDLTLGIGLLGMGGGSIADDEEIEDDQERGDKPGKVTSGKTGALGRRKSLRACKGKRYQEFMSTSKLVSGKRYKGGPLSFDSGVRTMPSKKRRHDSGSSTASEKTDSAFSEGSRGSRDPDETASLQGKSTPLVDRELEKTPKKKRRLSETSEESFSDSSMRKRFRAADFNLDEKIEALPSLSLEEFQQKKKAKKKRTSCSPSTPRKVPPIPRPEPVTPGDSETSESSPSKTPLVGSQKRKARRQQITRLDPNSPHSTKDTSVVEPEVLNTIGLATLAEVASAKRRIIK